MKNNKDTLLRLINEYHQKIEEYKTIEEDYKRLKLLESRIQTITVERTIHMGDVADEHQTENTWKSIVAEMGTRIGELLLEGNGLHVEQDFVSNHFGGMGLRFKTQFKFVKTIGSKTFGVNNY